MDKSYFKDKDENFVIQEELKMDPLDAYEIFSDIEHKCGVLVNDEKFIKPNITYKEFIDIFYEEIQKEKMNI